MVNYYKCVYAQSTQCLARTLSELGWLPAIAGVATTDFTLAGYRWYLCRLYPVILALNSAVEIGI